MFHQIAGMRLAIHTTILLCAAQIAGSGAHYRDDPAEPFFDPDSSVALWVDDFERSGEGSLDRYVTLGSEAIHLESGAGIGGSTAVRFDWTRSTDCRDESRLIEHAFPETPEVFLQFSVRYTRGFVFDWRGNGPCVGNAKKLFFLWSRSGSRFDVISENHAIGAGSDFDHPLFAQIGGALTPEALADGEWHRFTFHVRQSSTPTTADGFVYGWIDGKLKWARTAVATNNSGGYYDFKLPTTFNQGSPATQSEWLDDLRIWR
ncbi:MAG TPA: hypothetical protein VGQ30_10380 [Gemmatimonadaceae bacterium]|jgi:hypothetical protein|nr:hypothetical protein [Gemmatimonadaceae bacterium]